MEPDELLDLLARLRVEGSDSADVEVKAAHDGFPRSLAPTLSAFANMPGGGLLILGVDERLGFAPVGVHDAAGCKAALASLVRRGVEPPPTVRTWDVEVDGVHVVVAKVDELDASVKPARVSTTGTAYLRAHGGDHPLAPAEEQAMIAGRSASRFDTEPVPGTTVADLRADLVADYLALCRDGSTTLRAMPDEEVLFRTGVTVGAERSLTVAGLLALGTYPQQHLPGCVVRASLVPGPGAPTGTRALDSQRFDGPVPQMLDDAAAWVVRSTATRIRAGVDGHLRDEPDYPPEAVRELLSNALVHRDLGPWATGTAITLILDATSLLVANPGGLHHLSVERLGTTGVSSARNVTLLGICQAVRTRDRGRVVEALATGIPTVLRSLRAAGMLPPRFHDRGLSFAVTVARHSVLGHDDLDAPGAGREGASHLDDVQRHALLELRTTSPLDVREVARSLGVRAGVARTALEGLVDAGAATASGTGDDRRYAAAGRRATKSNGSPPPSRTTQHEGLTRNGPAILAALIAGPASLPELADRTGLTTAQLHYALRDLRRRGLVSLDGGRGRRASTYRSLRAG